MKRLTAWCSGNAYYPKCFEEPCGGMGCNDDKCGFMVGVCNRLAEYEDTGLTPEEIKSLNTFDGSQVVKATAKLQEEQRKHRWIPVSERLPVGKEFELKGGERTMYRSVLVQTASYNMYTAYYNTAMRAWCDDEGNELYAIAWMTLPEAYKPD